MQKTRVATTLLTLTLALALSASGAPALEAVYNAASWLPAGLPGDGVAQGAMFVVKGTGMGPETLDFPGTLPLTTEMMGTSISVTVGNVTESAFLVYTWTNQVAAVLPSTMPVGDGTLTVTYSGETSAPLAIKIVAAAFGMFARSSAGSGPAIVQNWYSPTDVRSNTLVESATPNQVMILWGSGLGAIAGDDSTTPPVGDIPGDVRVLVGGVEATVLYHGRSSEFPGIDQVQFLVPAGVEGCYVPIVVIVNGVASNFGTMSVAGSGGTCSDASTFLASDMNLAGQGQNTRFGGISILSVLFSAPGQPDPAASILLASAKVGSVTSAGMLQSFGPLGLTTNLLPASLGTCYGFRGVGDGLEFDDNVPLAELNAGASIRLTGPAAFGMKDLSEDGGSYLVEDDSPSSGLAAGQFTFSNGQGGADVGPLQNAQITVPNSQFVWTNRTAINQVSRSQDLLLTWSGGNDDSEYVVIIAHSNRTDLDLMGAVMCVQRVSAGQIVIPAWLLSTLPVSTPWNGDGDPTSGLIVGRISRMDQNRFTADGLDEGFLFYLIAQYRIVPFE